MLWPFLFTVVVYVVTELVGQDVLMWMLLVDDLGFGNSIMKRTF